MVTYVTEENSRFYTRKIYFITFGSISYKLEYVRYGIEMQKGTQKALRNQQKTIAKRKNNIRNIGSKTIYKK